MMAKRFVFWIIFIAFYVLFFMILKFVWNRFIPFNVLSDIIGIFVLIVINIPLSAICTQKLINVTRLEEV